MIVAMDSKGAIAKNGDIPWYIPFDLQFFKTMTVGKTIVMGRKTFETIGKPLPNRTNIVLTRQPERLHPEIIQTDKPSLVTSLSTSQEVFIAGGAEVYCQFLPLANKIYITEIDKDYEGDTFFPKMNLEKYKLISSWSNSHQTDDELLDFKIKVYDRR